MGKSGAKRKSQKAPSKPTPRWQPQPRPQSSRLSPAVIHNNNSKSHRENNHDENVALPREFPAHLPQPPRGSFLRDEPPYRESFRAAIRGPYEGFVVDDAGALSSFSSSSSSSETETGNGGASGRGSGSVNEGDVRSSLENMERDGVFRTDVTQPFGLGTKCAKTYVTRCLVGGPGTTYKYLGLRMFAHPWTATTTTTTTTTTTGSNRNIQNEIDNNNNNNNDNNNTNSSTGNNRRANKRRKRNPNAHDRGDQTKTNHPDERDSNIQPNDGVCHIRNHDDTCTDTFTYTSTIHELGRAMTKRTVHHLRNLDEQRRQRQALATRGRPDFDICLINRMESSSDLKPYNVFGGDHKRAANGTHKNRNNNNNSSNSSNNSNSNSNDNAGGDDRAKTSVSWHADSSLEHYSTIAVYQTLLGGSELRHSHSHNHNHKNKNKGGEERNDSRGQWWVALRVAHHAEGPQASQQRRKGTTGTGTESSSIAEDETLSPSPPVAVSLPSGSAYYLLDDFNHHHQHTVLTTGDAATAGVRYSCTFRLLRDSHNVRDWIDRGNAAVRQFHKKGPKVWRSEQLLLTEIETEWIRQFYVQGTGHHKLLWESYWKYPMKELLSIWSRLEARTKQTMDLLRAAAEGKCGIENASMDTKSGDSKSGESDAERKPTKADRKARDRRKKALGMIQDIVSRTNIHDDDTLAELYQPFAKLLEERAEMRELWEKREKDHVFREMPPDCRPMRVPFRFEEEHWVGNSSSTQNDEVVGKSPLPESPMKLKEMARDLLQCGKAYREGSAGLLPKPWRVEKSKTTPPNENESSNMHAKPMDWTGWGENDKVYGLELQKPWAGAVVDGKKLIETRSYTLPPSLIGRKIMIIESASGQAGVSGLGNHLSLSNQEGDGTKVIGWCIFSSVKKYTTGNEFRKEENLHLVTPDSGYGWKDGKMKHNIYGWVVTKYHRYKESSSSSDADTNFSGIRRFRSLFQLVQNVSETNSSSKKNENKSHHAGKNKRNGKRKRKRY